MVWFLIVLLFFLDGDIVGMIGDFEKGVFVFVVGGCVLCYIVKGVDDGLLVLFGGQIFEIEFGIFYVLNIFLDFVYGIGVWDMFDLVNVVKQGVFFEGQYYYFVFFYGFYIWVFMQDIVDLVVYMQILFVLDILSQDYGLIFLFNIWCLVGGWKLFFLSDDWVVDGDLID